MIKSEHEGAIVETIFFLVLFSIFDWTPLSDIVLDMKIHWITSIMQHPHPFCALFSWK